MTNKISLIISLICIILLIVVMIYGIDIGAFKVLSISQIKEQDDSLNTKINEASTLTTIEYPKNVDELNATYDRYKMEKQKYEELIDITNKKKSYLYEKKQYDISYMWRVLGKYAQNRNLTLAIDVKKTANDLYDFNFTVTGLYTDILKFIEDIENDSDLYFRIYNFSMEGNGAKITSTFTVKNINISSETLK